LEDLLRDHSPVVDSGCTVLQFLTEPKIVLPGQGDAVVGLEIAEVLLEGKVESLLTGVLDVIMGDIGRPVYRIDRRGGESRDRNTT